MPFYKYRCEKCGNTEELMCSYSEKAEKEKGLVCEKCQGKQFSPVFTKVLVSSNRQEIPMENVPQSSGCSSCSGGSCNSCGGL